MAPLGAYDAIALSVPIVRHMIGLLKGGKPDFAVWGSAMPTLTWSNIAREVLMDAGIDATVPTFSTIMACSTSMTDTFEAAGMIDGARILSQAIKQLASRPSSQRAIVSICADGGQGSVALLEAA